MRADADGRAFAKARGYSRSDLFRDASLRGEYTVGLRVVAVCPEVTIVGHTDELRRHTHATCATPGLFPPDAPFQDVLCAELTCDLAQGLRRGSILIGARARHDAHALQRGEPARDLLRHTFGEVRVLGTSEILERQHREHWHRGLRGGLRDSRDGSIPYYGSDGGDHAAGDCEVPDASPDARCRAAQAASRRRSVCGRRFRYAQRLHELLGRREAVGGDARERSPERQFDGLGHRLAERTDHRGRVPHPLRQHRLRGWSCEGWFTGQHLEENAAERIDVGAAVELVIAGGALGAHVSRCPQRRSGYSQRIRRSRNRARNTEISNERVAMVEQDILGLHIAVDDPAAVRVGQCVADLAGDAQRVVDRKLFLSFKAASERLALHVRHGVPEEPIGITGIEEWQDVRMGQSGSRFHLPMEAHGTELVGELGLQDLEGDQAMMPEVSSQKYDGHTAMPQLAPERVSTGERGAKPFVKLVAHGDHRLSAGT